MDVRLSPADQDFATLADARATAWPAGEIAELTWAFRQGVAQPEQRQTEVQALLQSIEAVLDHADVDIALTRNGPFGQVSRRFKDTAAHATGGALLRDIAQVLFHQVRRSDVVARLGGDGFAVLLPA